MSLLTKFTSDPRSFLSTYPALVTEMAVGAIKNAAFDNAATPQQNHFRLNALLCGFKISAFAQNTANISIHPHNTADAVDCYFLPYRPDNAVSMQLGNGADYFFTSTLTGCTVVVEGPANAPLVSHGNAGTRYNNALDSMKKIRNVSDLDGEDKIEALKECDRLATITAQGAINASFLSAGGGARAVLKKTDYVTKFNQHNWALGKGQYRTKKWWHRVKELNPELVGDYKPMVAAVVCGVRNPVANQWAFYWQANIEVSGRRRTGLLWGRKSKTISHDAVLLGPAQQLYP